MNTAIPDFNQEPGLNPQREYSIDSTGTEYIDPFTGMLRLTYKDLVVPGNGGLDIVINRVYLQSHQQTGVLGSGPYLTGSTTTGMGWDIHFGRVHARTLLFPNGCEASVDPQRSDGNPVLELPDGTRKTLYRNNVVSGLQASGYEYVTKDRWIATCTDAPSQNRTNGGMIVKSPDGVQYTFNHLQAYRNLTSVPSTPTPPNLNSNVAYHLTEIKDRNQNTITVHYEGYDTQLAQIKRVTSSDGRRIDFTYQNSGDSDARLHTIRANGQTWIYNYVNTSVSGYSYLDNVAGPEGLKWQYDYHNSGQGLHSVKKVTAPYGGTTTYTYQQRPRSSVSYVTPVQSTAVDTKTTGGHEIESGQWQYQFGVSGNLDQTTIIGPNRTEVYEHCGEKAAFAQSPATCEHNVGKLMNKKVFESSSSTPVQEEIYEWVYQKISNQDEHYPTRGTYSADVNADNLGRKTIIRDGDTYITEYNNYDDYGNPQQIVETSSAGVRTTSQWFYHNQSKWIINELERSRLIDIDHMVTNNIDSLHRSFDSAGNLDEETKYGVTTDYDYYLHPNSSKGEIQRVEDPLGNVSVYKSYKRGIPQREELPENVVIIRSVEDTGTIGREENGEGDPTSYYYDRLNRVDAITTARSDDDNISVTANSFSSRIKIVRRGNYRQETRYDGFGRVKSVESGGIRLEYDYDEDGRRAFESYPHATSVSNPKGVEYHYDALDRLVRKEFTAINNLDIEYDYLTGNKVKVTDQEGHETTYTYRSFGDPDDRQLMEIKEPETTTTISRTKRGDIRTVTQGDLTRQYIYDSRYMLDKIINPETGTTDLYYDDAGNLKTRQVGTSNITTYYYDDLNRVEDIEYADNSPDVSYTYDKNSNTKTITTTDTVNNVVSVWEYFYDKNENRTKEELDYDGMLTTIEHGFDKRDFLDSMTLPSGIVIDYAPDALGRATKVGTYASNLKYHPNGQLHEIRYGNGEKVEYEIDERQFISDVIAGSNVNLEYKYYDDGNVQLIRDKVSSSYGREMRYDDQNRLRTVDGAWGRATINYTQSGDISDMRVGFDYQVYDYATNGLLDRIDGGLTGTRIYGYDAYGNVTDDSINTYTYGDDGNMHSATVLANNLPVSFEYDGNNRLLHRTVDSNGEYLVYGASGRLIQERDQLAIKTREYVYLGAMAIAQIDDCFDGDRDGDGIQDCAELENGLNPSISGDALLDKDEDGLSNLLEYQNGYSIIHPDSDGDGLDDFYEHNTPPLDALNADTDGDLIPDGYEFNNHTDPVVPDGSDDNDVDGVSNYDEYIAGTDSSTSDTDGDTLTDRFELDNGSNPLYTDSDCDGMPDGFEFTYSLITGVDDADADKDGDGFSNLREYRANSNPDSSDPNDPSSKPGDATVQGYYEIGYGVAPFDNIAGYGDEGIDPAIGPDGTVYVATDRLYAFYAEGGAEKWSAHVELQPDGNYGSVVSGNYVSLLYCPDNNQNNKGWQISRVDDSAPTNGLAYYSPSIGADGSIYLGASDGNLYAFKPNGDLKWVSQGNGPKKSPSISIENVVYVGVDGALHAINADTGNTNWSVMLDSANGVSDKPSIGLDGTIYILDRSGKLHAVNPDSSLQSTTNSNWPVDFNRDGSGFNPPLELNATPVINDNGVIIVSVWDKHFEYHLGAVHPDGTVLSERNIGGTEPNDRYGDPVLSTALADDGGSLLDFGMVFISTSNLQLFDKFTLTEPNPGGGPPDADLYEGPFMDYDIYDNQVATTPVIDSSYTVYVAGRGGLLSIKPDPVALSFGFVEYPFIDFTDPTQFDTPEPIDLTKGFLSRPVIGNLGNIYAATPDRLYVFNSNALGTGDSVWPMFGHDQRRTSDVRTGVNGVYLLEIIFPLVDSIHDQGDPIKLAAQAFDVSSGNISSQIVWSSDIDGAIGTGEQLSIASLSAGEHVITAEITDSNGETSSTFVAMEVCSPLDADGDQIPDCYERYWGIENADVTKDSDGDGLDFLEEYLADTNPFVFDTDTDGMPDGFEVDYGLDPLIDDANGDADDDLIVNILEYQFGSNVNSPSSVPGIGSRGTLRWYYEFNHNVLGEVAGPAAVKDTGEVYLMSKYAVHAIDPSTATAPTDSITTTQVPTVQNIFSEWVLNSSSISADLAPGVGQLKSGVTISEAGDLLVEGAKNGGIISQGTLHLPGSITKLDTSPSSSNRIIWTAPTPAVPTGLRRLSLYGSSPPVLSNTENVYDGNVLVSDDGVLGLNHFIEILNFSEYHYVPYWINAVGRNDNQVYSLGKDHVALGNNGDRVRVHKYARNCFSGWHTTLASLRFNAVTAFGNSDFSSIQPGAVTVSKNTLSAGLSNKIPSSLGYAGLLDSTKYEQGGSDSDLVGRYLRTLDSPSIQRAGDPSGWAGVFKEFVPPPAGTGQFGTPICTRYAISYSPYIDFDGQYETWRISDLRSAVSAPVMDSSNRIYLNTSEFGLIVLDADTGEAIWMNNDVGSSAEPMPPVLGDDGVIYVADGRFVTAVSPNGVTQWKRRLHLPVQHPPVLSPDGSLIVLVERAAYAFNTSSSGLMKSSWPYAYHDTRNTSNLNTPINDRSEISLTSPADELDVIEDDIITFQASASDIVNGDLSANIEWVSSIQGILGTGGSITTSLDPGRHIISASVIDTFGETLSSVVYVNSDAIPPNVPPELTVSSPTDGGAYLEGQPINFTATSIDAIDGDLSSSLAWSSSLSGYMGTGASVVTNLSVGSHLISIVSTDSGGLASSAYLFITVYSAEDADGDGMKDAWELEEFGTLDRDGTGDFDGDGITDLQEFLDQLPVANSGDIDNDGKITSADIYKVEQFVLNAGSLDADEVSAADVYPFGGDGVVDINDLVELRRLSLRDF